MGLVTLPNTLANATPAVGEQVRANDDAILSQAVNGNITDVNIAAGAAISGSKISNVAGSRVPTDRIDDDAITADKLADHATVDASRAVTTNHIRLAAVTSDRLAAQAVIAAKVKVSTFDWSPGGTLLAGADNSISSAVVAANVVPLCIATVLAGVPTTGTAKFNASLHLNTATGFYHIVIQNAHDTINASLAGVTFRFYYIAAA